MPSVVGMTPVDAALYLSAIGRVDMPVPLRFARALLDPDFRFPKRLADIASVDAVDAVRLRGVTVNEQHQLEYHKQPADPDARSHGFARSASPLIIGDGWRSAAKPVFEARDHGKIDVEPFASWSIDHDVSRLVRLHAPNYDDDSRYELPVVEVEDIMPEVSAVLRQISENPAVMLKDDERQAVWRRSQPYGLDTVHRIVEGILREYVPWPFPFRLRTRSELLLSRQEIAQQVAALFHQLLQAPQPTRPSNLVCYFLSLIDRGRADFTAWSENLHDVWGFKMKTGDHDWIEGQIWVEPGLSNEPTDQIQEVELPGGSFGAIRLEMGNLRCYICRRK